MMSMLEIIILSFDLVFTLVNIYNFIKGNKDGLYFLIYGSVFSQILITISIIRIIAL